MTYSGKLDLTRKINLVVGENLVGKTSLIKQQMKEISENIDFIEYPEKSLFPVNIITNCNTIVKQAINANYILIVETNSTHFVNHIRYLVFSKVLDSKDVIINFFSKDDGVVTIQNISINAKGKYIDSSNQEIKFPEGFFDADIVELLEMT